MEKYGRIDILINNVGGGVPLAADAPAGSDPYLECTPTQMTPTVTYCEFLLEWPISSAVFY